MGRDQGVNISIRLLKDLLFASGLVHGSILILWLFDIYWTGFLFWELLGFLSSTSSLILTLYLPKRWTKYVLGIPFVFCSMRWILSWSYGESMEVYTTTISVLIYLPLLINLGIQFGLRLSHLIVWSTVMGLSTLYGHTRPILEDTPLNNWLLTPIFIVTVILYSMSFIRWRYNTKRLEESLDQERKLTILLQAETAKQLGKRMEAISRLSGNVAHEFNNLLTIIIPLSTSLRDALPEGEQRSEAKDILEAGLRAQWLGQQLRSLTKTYTVIDEEVNLNHFISTYKDELNTRKPRFSSALDLNIQLNPHESLIVPAHHIDLTKLLDILLENAVEASSKSQAIQIQLCKRRFSDISPPVEQTLYGEVAVLSVLDHGCGIDPDLLPNIFDPYVSTHRAKNRGLGLTTAYVITLRSGGSIRVESTVNVGTQIFVYLPLLQSKPTTIVNEPSGLDEFNIHQLNIIIIDDEPAITRILSRTLKRKGAQVTAFTDPEEALQHLTEHSERYHLIVTDVLMPKYTGPEIIQSLNELDLSLPPVLYITGHIDDQAANTFQVSEESIIFKPFTSETFLNRIEYILRASRTKV